VPVALRFLLALLRHPVESAADVLEFHRIEPFLAFRRDRRPKTLVMHQNMNDLRNLGSDIRWRHFPSLYFKLEDYVLPKLSSLFCVREDAAAAYRQRFPSMQDRIHFTPTWMDPETFCPADAVTRRQRRAWLSKEHGVTEEEFVLVTVGRLEVEQRIAEYGLESEVRLLGVQPARTIAAFLQASDLFVLSSAYEGMPIVVLEALGTGLPVAATDVGEVSRVVRSGINGELVAAQDAGSLANAIRVCRGNVGRYRGRPCVETVRAYTPQYVLAPIYDNYRRLATRPALQAVGQ
jgi:glycosyltransferase involved in cell wall biosynthesis